MYCEKYVKGFIYFGDSEKASGFLIGLELI
jgi:hypothetical protein